MVTGNPRNGKQVKVDWQKNFKPFKIDGRGAYRSTISKVNYKDNIKLIFGEKEKSEKDALAFDESDSQETHPLNQILYGPPGTGKTYHSINKTVAIIDSLREESLFKFYNDRMDLKARFDELLIDDWDNAVGQVGFITFHQSMAYEDFIEGIKPITTTDQKVVYDVVPGIFKNLCEIAKDNWLDAHKGSKGNLSFEEAFLKLKEAWDEDQAIKFPLKTAGNDFTIIGFTNSSIKFRKANGGTGHTLSISTLRDYYYNRKEVRLTGVGIYYPSILKKLKSFQPASENEKEEKKYVLIIDEINRGNVSQIFGELITLIEEDKRLGKEETLEVTLPYSKEKFGVPPNLYIIGTMNTADKSVEALDTALRRRFNFEEMPPKPELISSQKKLWNLLWRYPEIDWKDEPYLSKEKNLFKLFQFNSDDDIKVGEIWYRMRKEGKSESQIEYFNDFSTKGINLETLLSIVNNRIEKLLDKDHQIGHSYFICVNSIEDLKNTFYNKIIPLLQEYFFGDYGKIGLVLGKGFIKRKEWDETNSSFAAFDYESANSFDDRDVFEIIDYRNNQEEYINYKNTSVPVTFEKAIKLLINNTLD